MGGYGKERRKGGMRGKGEEKGEAKGKEGNEEIPHLS